MHNENLPKISEPFNHPKEQGYYYTRLGLNSDEESGDIRYVEDFKDEDGKQWYKAQILYEDLEVDGFIIEVRDIDGEDDLYEVDIHTTGSKYIRLTPDMLEDISLRVEEAKENLDLLHYGDEHNAQYI